MHKCVCTVNYCGSFWRYKYHSYLPLLVILMAASLKGNSKRRRTNSKHEEQYTVTVRTSLFGFAFQGEVLLSFSFSCKSFVTLSLPTNLTKPRKLLNDLNYLMKPEGVTTQMKALDEYFVMVVFTLLLNKVHIFSILCLIWTLKHGSESWCWLVLEVPWILTNVTWQWLIHHSKCFAHWRLLDANNSRILTFW